VNGDAGDELVDVLDEHGNPVGVETRRVVRERNLWHRSVFIAVITSRDELVVHQRASWKDIWPSRWDVAFGGVLGHGEDPTTAAMRELAEEAAIALGPQDVLVPVGEGSYDDELVREHSTIYVVEHDGPYRFADGEVVASQLVELPRLDQWIGGRSLCPDSLALVVPFLRDRAERGRSVRNTSRNRTHPRTV
jgi:isopentenyldiphosphate isomerase